MMNGDEFEADFERAMLEPITEEDSARLDRCGSRLPSVIESHLEWKRRKELEEGKVVLEVRPIAEDSRSLDALAAWVRGNLGYVARVAGYGAQEVTHVRLWRDGRVVEVALGELLMATGDGDSGGRVVRVDSERVGELD